jgi:hypothetical protein
LHGFPQAQCNCSGAGTFAIRALSRRASRIDTHSIHAGQHLPLAAGLEHELITQDFMKRFLKAWARGVSIFAFFICLSIVLGVLAAIGEVLPPFVSVPVIIAFGPPVIYWVSSWLAPDLFPPENAWWKRGVNRKDGW